MSSERCRRRSVSIVPSGPIEMEKCDTDTRELRVIKTPRDGGWGKSLASFCTIVVAMWRPNANYTGTLCCENEQNVAKESRIICAVLFMATRKLPYDNVL